MENNMETAIIYRDYSRGYIGVRLEIMEKKKQATTPFLTT